VFVLTWGRYTYPYIGFIRLINRIREQSGSAWFTPSRPDPGLGGHGPSCGTARAGAGDAERPDTATRPKLLQQVRIAIRRRHYSRRTEEASAHRTGASLLDLSATGALCWPEDRLPSTRRSGGASCSLMGVRKQVHLV
jgi:hypothetical protein